jgi:hypothetical protein
MSKTVEEKQVVRSNENIFLFIPNLIGKEKKKLHLCLNGRKTKKGKKGTYKDENP